MFSSVKRGTFLGLSICNAALACAQTQCTPAQLTGGDGVFTISTGNGTYLQGSSQAIIWNQPSGNPIRRISNNITIFSNTVQAIIAEAENITEAPVVILNRTIAHTGGIGVTIPSSLPDGDDYVYRVIVRSRRGHCYIDSNTFSVRRTVAPPQENCRPGSMRCVDDNSSFEQCVETDDTDTIFSFGLPIDCAATTECIQITDFTIGCSPGGTNPGECELGTTDCIDATHSRVCINGPANTPIWGPSQECEPGFECNDDNGQCEPGPPSTTSSVTSATATATSTIPPDECILGTQECVTETSNRVCLVGPSGNAVWGPETLCPAGTTCLDGLCTSGVPGGSSTLGTTSVTTETATATSSDGETASVTFTSTNVPPETTVIVTSTTFEVTITLSTSAATATATGTSVATTSTTTSTATSIPIPNECVLGTQQCVTELSNRICIEGPNGGTIWGPVTECPAGTTCTDGLCTSGGTGPTGTGTTTVIATSTDGFTTVSTNTGGGPATLTTIVIETSSVFSTSVVTDTIGSTTNVPVTTTTILVPSTTTTIVTTTTSTPVPDECVLGDRECVTDIISRECVLIDGRAVWQNSDCSPGTTCADGICTSGIPGGTACFPRTQICLSDTTYDECAQNDDGFWEFGGVTSTCGPGRVCVPYFNSSINCVIPEPAVLRRRRNRYSFFI